MAEITNYLEKKFYETLRKNYVLEDYLYKAKAYIAAFKSHYNELVAALRVISTDLLTVDDKIDYQALATVYERIHKTDLQNDRIFQLYEYLKDAQTEVLKAKYQQREFEEQCTSIQLQFADMNSSLSAQSAHYDYKNKSIAMMQRSIDTLLYKQRRCGNFDSEEVNRQFVDLKRQLGRYKEENSKVYYHDLELKRQYDYELNKLAKQLTQHKDEIVYRWEALGKKVYLIEQKVDYLSNAQKDFTLRCISQVSDAKLELACNKQAHGFRNGEIPEVKLLQEKVSYSEYEIYSLEDQLEKLIKKVYALQTACIVAGCNVFDMEQLQEK